MGDDRRSEEAGGTQSLREASREGGDMEVSCFADICESNRRACPHSVRTVATIIGAGDLEGENDARMDSVQGFLLDIDRGKASAWSDLLQREDLDVNWKANKPRGT